MKLRVRVRKQTSRLELEAEQPTLGDLRSKLSSVTLPSLGYSAETHFTITLNGKDALTEDQTTLESAGIISGDLIVVLLPDSPQLAPPPAPERRVPRCPLEDPTQPCSTANKRPKGHADNEGAGAMPQAEASPSLDDVAMEGQLSGPAWEVMLCSEAVDGKIPHSLEVLYQTASCTTASDAFIVVIHLLMLETGYLHKGAETKALCMPRDWRSGGAYRLHYTHPLCAEVSATLVCLPMGKLVIINATMKINSEMKSVRKLQLSTNSYISYPETDNNVASVYKDLQKLSGQFKDQVAYPLLAAARQVLNLPDVFGLLVLPPELKLRIFRLLDIRSLLNLSATCKELLADTDDPSLWRFLCIRDFRNSLPRNLGTDWKKLYKEKFKQKMDRNRFVRRQFLPPRNAHPYPYYPNVFPPDFNYPPGIIGGDYDQRPFPPIVNPTHLNPFKVTLPFSENDPSIPGSSGLRPSRGRGLDIRRGFI
ncbi:F-box protein 7 L homeolog isoform X1 [Xenopus laevis]|uniref:F-box only protein 7 n=1 Tax=Xenopus laevis TaxID=8355 RepID=A0A8J0U525_XENLA|nr:F-box protein 7 L homeolog isoform X1 [Xenopus laevis]XP_018096330.1 F-box protein 7 L homeolog isoform X1 [Xenopus laevis]OCT58156.1 hypothetical protein XELAEV_18002485mg [Xenopus laevis]